MKKILWFRRDLRIEDSMLLSQSGEVLPIFIFDKNILEKLYCNDARVCFIYQSVLKLKSDLCSLGLDLAIFYGTPLEVFFELKKQGFYEVYASVDYDEYARKRDEAVGEILSFHALNDCYIFEPHEVLKSDGTPYLVFTPFYKAGKQLYTQFHALSYIKGKQSLASFSFNTPPTLESMGFNDLHVRIIPPKQKLALFCEKIASYEKERDCLDRDATSHLSLDLRFGTLSIRAILRKLIELKNQSINTDPFFRQLVFRDYYAYLFYHFPSLAWKNYKHETPTSFNETYFEAFCSAQTGYPLIDAGIQELLQTGTMHNRVRMVVGSFFTKHLMLPWQEGEAFFARHLMDYDASANILSWQWCAGTGIDPQPYFRIFNPYAQSKKFDKNATYIKTYLPILNDIPSKYVHDESYLLNHEITGYPKPIISHEIARKRFLNAFK